jgi:hypothetical protein
MAAVIDHPAGHDDHAHDHPHGWRRWLFATNHKDKARTIVFLPVVTPITVV